MTAEHAIRLLTAVGFIPFQIGRIIAERDQLDDDFIIGLVETKLGNRKDQK